MQFAQAEKAYRQALAIEPGFPEARLRLGRILYLLDRNVEAQQELERAFEDAQRRRDLFTGYLAALFLGRLHEDAGRVELAKAEFRNALGVYPAGQDARLSLGRLELASGRAAEGWSMIRSMFDSQLPVDGEPLDPWYAYPSFDRERWGTTQRLLELRGMIRQ